MAEDIDRASERVQTFVKKIGALREEVGRVIVGHREVVDGVIICMRAGSHALLEGVPGLGKTLLVRTVARALELPFSRMQYTPDMMPAAIIGTTVVEESTPGRRSDHPPTAPVFDTHACAAECT